MKKNRAHIAAASVLLAGAYFTASAQVYKCPDATGRTVIQQAPCLDGQRLTVKPATGHDNIQKAQAAKARTARQGNAQDILVAIAEGRPAIGMTEDELRSALGQPDRINHGNYQGRTSEQWVYRRGGEPLYVYVRGGTVTAFQSTEVTGTGSTRQCPSAMDVRNLETSASSVTISAERRRALRRQIDDAKACR